MGSVFEKGLDFTFGVAVLTAEALNQAITALREKGKVAQEHGPAVFDAILEKGRPLRETLLRNLREEIEPLKQCGVGAATDEIKALEERVASLEQQVSPASSVAEAQEAETPIEPAAPPDAAPADDARDKAEAPGDAA